jgi:hypothetical protein
MIGHESPQLSHINALHWQPALAASLSGNGYFGQWQTQRPTRIG